MANLRQAKATLKNAQALELFMRASPEAAPFLECFSFKQVPNNFQVAFNYDKPLPNEKEIKEAEQCSAHLQTFFREAEKILGKRITSSPARSKRANLKMSDIEALGIKGIKTMDHYTTENESITMQLAINLSNPRLSDILLDLAVRLINQQRNLDRDFTLSYFLPRENAAEEYAVMDSKLLYDKLSRGFPQAVTRKDLEALLPQMEYLAQKFREAKLPERYR